jgi:hypothetical protein
MKRPFANGAAMCLLLAAVSAYAQETSEPADADPVIAGPAPVEGAADDTADEAGDDREVLETDDESYLDIDDEDFTPSEEIPSDESIPFPTDI